MRYQTAQEQWLNPGKSWNSQKNSQSQKGHQEQQMTEGTFLLYATEKNCIRSHLSAINRLDHSLTKERKEGRRPQDPCTKDLHTLFQGFALQQQGEGLQASTGMHTCPGWTCSHSSPPTSQRCYWQGTWQPPVTTDFFPAQGHKSEAT